jgi:hypothetical protein
MENHLFLESLVNFYEGKLGSKNDKLIILFCYFITLHILFETESLVSNSSMLMQEEIFLFYLTRNRKKEKFYE